MKGKFWRKALAAALALLIVSGGVPVKPFTEIFSPVAITAEAAGIMNFTDFLPVSSSGTASSYFYFKNHFYKVEWLNIDCTRIDSVKLSWDTSTKSLLVSGKKNGIITTSLYAESGNANTYLKASKIESLVSGRVCYGYTKEKRLVSGAGTSNAKEVCKITCVEGYVETWNWSDDNSTCTATFACKNYPSLTATVPATVDNKGENIVAKVNFNGIEYRSSKPVNYTVTWKNDDGTVLETGTYGFLKTPSYTGETPTKASDEEYRYIFSGWSPEVSDVTKDVTYTAQYTKKPLYEPFSQDDENTYTIHDETGWDIFCDCLQDSSYDGFSGKTVVLDKDITVTEMAGSRENPFKGTFDGGKHTITADISGSTMGVAVFSGINTATIKDLTLSGSITGGQHCGALVGLADGTNTIENVNVTADVRLDSSISAGQAHHGGVIGHALSSNTTLRGVVYSGTISSTSASNYVYVGGLVGWADDATITIENSLFAGTYNGGTLFHPILCKTGDKTVNGTFTNVYYTTAPTATNTNYYVANAGKTTHTITAGESVTIDYGTATKTYDVSGITAYGTGLAYNGNFYAGEGDEVALTLDNTAPEGYTFNGYTVDAGTLADGTLTMPDTDVTVSAEFEKAQEPVTYIDENGVEQTVADYTVLTGTETTLEAGWYVVNSNISYDHTLNINGNVSLILSDGYTMTVEPTGYGRGIYDSSRVYSLDVYGQSNGTEKLSIATKGSFHYDAEQGYIGEIGNSIDVDTYTQHSGNVEISTSGESGSGITGNKAFIKGGILNTNTVNSGICVDEVTIIGGKIMVGAANNENGIYCCNRGLAITLGLTNPEDFITASSYFVPEEFVLNGEVLEEAGTLKIADGQTLTDGTNAYSGTLSPEQITALSGKTLVLANAVNIANGIENGTVTADKAAVAKSAKDDERTVTLTVTPDEGYAVKSVSVNGEIIEPVEGVYSFEMPAEDVTVSAEFEKAKYTVILPDNMEITNGVTLTDGKADYGTEIKFRVKDGYTASGVSDGTNTLTPDENGVYTVTVTGDVTVTAEFAQIITYTPVPAKDPTYIEAGNSEYYIGSDGKYYILTDGEYVETTLDAVTIPKLIAYTVTVRNGTVNNETSATVDKGTSVTVTANEAPAGKTFSYWMDGNGRRVSTDSEYTFTPTADTTVTAVFSTASTVTVTNGTVTKKNGTALDTPADSVSVVNGQSVTVTADAPEKGQEFIGWYYENGNQVLSNSTEYTFTVVSGTNIEARFQSVEGIVTFYSNGIIQGSFTGSEITEENFPIAPTPMAGFVFTGWDKTAEQINTALENHENVTVNAIFAVKQQEMVLTVYNGGSETSTQTTYTQSQWISVTAEDVPGKIFAYWKINEDENNKNYNKTFSYRINSNMTIRAVYSDTEVEALGTATITSKSYDASAKKATFVAYLTVPEGATISRLGLIATNAGPGLTMENAQFIKVSSKATGTSIPWSFTWTKTKVNSGDTWYVRAYVIYTDRYGNEHTILGTEESYTAQ